MFDVVTIGSATLDVFLCCINFIPTDVNGEKKMCFPHGAKVEVNEALFETGGGGTNTATTFVRMGLKTGVVAKVGADFAGGKVLQRLSEDHIDTRFVIQDTNDTTDFST